MELNSCFPARLLRDVNMLKYPVTLQGKELYIEFIVFQNWSWTSFFFFMKHFMSWISSKKYQQMLPLVAAEFGYFFRISHPFQSSVFLTDHLLLCFCLPFSFATCSSIFAVILHLLSVSPPSFPPHPLSSPTPFQTLLSPNPALTCSLSSPLYSPSLWLFKKPLSFLWRDDPRDCPAWLSSIIPEKEGQQWHCLSSQVWC